MEVLQRYFLKKYFTYLFLERGEGREKERERNINVWLPLTYPPLGTWPATQACALDWGSNWQPPALQFGAQSTEPHQPGTKVLSYLILTTMPGGRYHNYPYFINKKTEAHSRMTIGLMSHAHKQQSQDWNPGFSSSESWLLRQDLTALLWSGSL